MNIVYIEKTIWIGEVDCLVFFLFRIGKTLFLWLRKIIRK